MGRFDQHPMRFLVIVEASMRSNLKAALIRIRRFGWRGCADPRCGW